MKHWLIEYSIKYAGGRVREGQAELETENIRQALNLAIANIQRPLMNDPEIADVVIWSVGIVEEDVFPEEEE